MNNTIIIKDLMTHSTGLPRHDGSWYYFPSHDKDSLLMRLKHHEPFTGIRQQWNYNNYGFLAQGVIAEHITGKSWEDNLKDHFFTPLEMSRTNTSIAEMKSSSNASIGYEIKDDVIKKMDYYDIAGMSPAGSINSSVNDMSKWLMTWINDGTYKGEEIIPSNYINEALSSQMVVSGNTPDDKFPDIHFSNYGYGWFLQSYKGHYRVDHGGNIDGFSANVAFFPSDSIGIVVLANQNGSSVPTLVRNTIADRMLAEERTDWISRYK
jgi:CubicO group peptidase (beta-lactamase class C family)